VEKVKEPPVIVLKPETITVPEGDWARFAVRITGFPRPRVMWPLNGHTAQSTAVRKAIEGHRTEVHIDSESGGVLPEPF